MPPVAVTASKFANLTLSIDFEITEHTNGQVAMIWLGFSAASFDGLKQPNSLLKCVIS